MVRRLSWPHDTLPCVLVNFLWPYHFSYVALVSHKQFYLSHVYMQDFRPEMSTIGITLHVIYGIEFLPMVEVLNQYFQGVMNVMQGWFLANIKIITGFCN